LYKFIWNNTELQASALMIASVTLKICLSQCS